MYTVGCACGTGICGKKQLKRRRRAARCTWAAERLACQQCEVGCRSRICSNVLALLWADNMVTMCLICKQLKGRLLSESLNRPRLALYRYKRRQWSGNTGKVLRIFAMGLGRDECECARAQQTGRGRSSSLQGEYLHLADDVHEGGLRHGEERREPGVQSAVPLPSSGAREGKTGGWDRRTGRSQGGSCPIWL